MLVYLPAPVAFQPVHMSPLPVNKDVPCEFHVLDQVVEGALVGDWAFGVFHRGRENRSPVEEMPDSGLTHSQSYANAKGQMLFTIRFVDLVLWRPK